MGILIKAPVRRNEGSPAVAEASPGAVHEPRSALHIREVVRITGLRREQLYMWQRRYGFPSPLRDPFGDRVYPPEQVARLKLIKQLLSEGWRAGAVVPLAESALQSMLGLTVEDPAPLPVEIATAVDLLSEHRIGDKAAVFEATHGTAPKYAGLDKINPGSVILSGCMMSPRSGGSPDFIPTTTTLPTRPKRSTTPRWQIFFASLT